MKDNKRFNLLAQFVIPTLTISAQIAVALKIPQWGLLISMSAQPFWLYSSWKAYKKAGQIGLFITAIIITIVFGFGIFNYWVLDK